MTATNAPTPRATLRLVCVVPETDCDDGDSCTEDYCSVWHGYGSTIRFSATMATSAPRTHATQTLSAKMALAASTAKAVQTMATPHHRYLQPRYGAIHHEQKTAMTVSSAPMTHVTRKPEHVSMNPCADDNPCTYDTCTPVQGNDFAFECGPYPPLECDDDGDDVPSTRAILARVAVTGPKRMMATHAARTCDPATGCTFVNGDCDDGNSCTLDECTAEGCVHTPKAARTATSAQSITAIPNLRPVIANSTRLIVVMETPAPKTSATRTRVHAQQAENCNDDDDCTEDNCDPDSGNCLNPSIDCDDGNACTDDACFVKGGCKSVAIVCDDGVPLRPISAMTKRDVSTLP